MMNYTELEKRVIADHAAVAKRLCLCRYVIGYIEDTDEQTDLDLDPPILVTVDELLNPNQGLLHNTGTHLDPYWDITPYGEPDPRIAHLRSLFTYGLSYNLETGERDKQDNIQPCCWLAPIQALPKRSWWSWLKGLMS